MKRIIPILAACLLVLVTALTVFLYVNRERVAYFDYNEVYNNSDLKKKLEKDLERVVGLRKSQLDSMQLELSFVSQKIQAGTMKDPAVLGKFEDDKSRYMTYQSQFEEENGRLKETYFNQIRKDINDKSVLFAKEEGYTFLFAAMGDGALMYADESRNVTKDFQEFINK
jgi:Skp family chaperone for outer membrane proteins